jgi:hypothetical protein
VIVVAVGGTWWSHEVVLDGEALDDFLLQVEASFASSTWRFNTASAGFALATFFALTKACKASWLAFHRREQHFVEEIPTRVALPSN